MKEGAFLLIRKSRDSGNEVAKYKQTQPAFTCSKFKKESLEQGGVVLVEVMWMRSSRQFQTFLRKDFARTKRIQANKNKKWQHFYAHKKHLRGRKSLVHLFASLCFLCFFVLFVLFGLAKSFRKKIKRFKIALITSFTLLLKKMYFLFYILHFIF